MHYIYIDLYILQYEHHSLFFVEELLTHVTGGSGSCPRVYVLWTHARDLPHVHALGAYP
jgi:hypothetical protein